MEKTYTLTHGATIRTCDAMDTLAHDECVRYYQTRLDNLDQDADSSQIEACFIACFSILRG